MEKIFIIIFAVVQAQYREINFLRDWAKNLLSNSPSKAEWLIKISECSSLECAENATRIELKERRVDISLTFPGLLLGFVFLKYKERKISIDEFKSELIDIIDGYHIKGFDIDQIQADISSFDTNIHLQESLDKLARQSADELAFVTSMEIKCNLL